MLWNFKQFIEILFFSFFFWNITHPIFARIIGKSSFQCKPDTANVCCVRAFLPSIQWVKFYTSMFGRWTSTCAVYKIEQQKTRALPQFDILWCFILCVYNTAAQRTWDVGILEEQNIIFFFVCCVLFFFFVGNLCESCRAKKGKNWEKFWVHKRAKGSGIKMYPQYSLCLRFPCTIQLVFLLALLYVINLFCRWIVFLSLPAIQP